MNKFIELLEIKINGCDALGGLEREKAVYQSVLKDYKQQLKLCEVGVMFKEKQINRFEVIDKIGRAYVNCCDRPLKIEGSLQDNERTLKIFLDD